MNPMKQIRIEKVTVNIGVGKDLERLEKAKKLLERIAGIEKLNSQDKKHIYYLIDGLVRDANTRQAYEK